MKYFNKSQELQKIDNECDKLVEIELFNKKFFFCLYLRKRCWLFSAWEKGTLEEKETMDFVVADGKVTLCDRGGYSQEVTKVAGKKLADFMEKDTISDLTVDELKRLQRRMRDGNAC